MKTIVFQGDSITACGRLKYDVDVMGEGYARFVRASLAYDYPGEYKFYNRGVSGDRVINVYARIGGDIIRLAPDYLSILVGVNDVWHELDFGNGINNEKFEKIYCMMIEEIQEALPNTKIMILEPFCLEGEVTVNTEEQPDRWNQFRGGVEERAAKAKAVAEKYNLAFIPLQDKFDKMAKITGPSYWSVDGVHPSIEGHELIKREWLKMFSCIG